MPEVASSNLILQQIEQGAESLYHWFLEVDEQSSPEEQQKFVEAKEILSNRRRDLSALELRWAEPDKMIARLILDKERATRANAVKSAADSWRGFSYKIRTYSRTLGIGA